MMHKAWCNVERVPYNFWRSSIKFQVHTGGLANRRFESNLSKITRPLEAIKSLMFALLSSIFLLMILKVHEIDMRSKNKQT